MSLLIPPEVERGLMQIQLKMWDILLLLVHLVGSASVHSVLLIEELAQGEKCLILKESTWTPSGVHLWGGGERSNK